MEASTSGRFGASPMACSNHFGMRNETMTRKVLLLDYDHTLYPSTLETLRAVDNRITLYIETFLGLSPEASDAMRQSLCAEFGTTLRGLEEHHGVEREHYCDFIHEIEDEFLPPPDPVLEN